MVKLVVREVNTRFKVSVRIGRFRTGCIKVCITNILLQDVTPPGVFEWQQLLVAT